MGSLNSCSYDFFKYFLLTEPRWALQPQSTQWFPWIGLFVVQAISLGPCRRPIEFLTSSNPCGRLSKFPNCQTKVGHFWKINLTIMKFVQFSPLNLWYFMFGIKNFWEERINSGPIFSKISTQKCSLGQITTKNLSLCSWEITKKSFRLKNRWK